MNETMKNKNLILATRTILVNRNIFNVEPKFVEAPKNIYGRYLWLNSFIDVLPIAALDAVSIR